MRKIVGLIGVAVVAAMAPGLGATAGAATKYPPPASIGTSCSTSMTPGSGRPVSVRVGCPFKPGTPVTITVDGRYDEVHTAPSSGVLLERFDSHAGRVTLWGGHPVSARRGSTTTFVATGLNPQGTTNVATTLLSAPVAATPGPGGADLAVTGSDIMAMIIGMLALCSLSFLIFVFSRPKRSGAAA